MSYQKQYLWNYKTTHMSKPKGHLEQEDICNLFSF